MADSKAPSKSKSKKQRGATRGGARKKTQSGARKKTQSGAIPKTQTGASRTRKSAAPTGPPLKMTVAVCESTPSAGERARAILAELGCTVTPETTADKIAQRCAGNVPPDAVIVAVPGAEEVIAAARGRATAGPVVIGALGGPALAAADRGREAGADLFVVRPHGSEALASALIAARALTRERATVRALESTEAMLRERLLRYGQADAETGFQHFDFFKQFLVIELKRAKRYGYPLAACLVAIDQPAEPAPAPALLRALRRRVAATIAATIRDIDLPVDLDEERFLVFLPYTDIAGAENVGKRVASAVAGFGGDDADLTVSVGISATRPGKPISFARLMRDANAAVRASQLKGGGRVVVRK